MFVLSSGQLLCLSWEIQSCDFNLCRVALITDIFRQPHYQLQGRPDCCGGPRSSVAPAPWQVQMREEAAKTLWGGRLFCVSSAMGLCGALPTLGLAGALQWCPHLWAHSHRQPEASVQQSTAHAVCCIHCTYSPGVRTEGHIQPTAPDTMSCGFWALSSRNFALQILFSGVTAHRPSSPVDRAMDCHSGCGDAQQAKRVIVTQRLNRHHTGTKPHSWPVLFSVHILDMQFSQRGSGALVISPMSSHLWRGDRTGAKQKVHGRVYMNLKGGWLLFPFLFGKGFV